MIIFGTRVRHKEIGEGQFFCPRCQARRAYKHKKASRYFALYFVPLIPMGELGEFVECQTCHTAFEPSVLQIKGPVQPGTSNAPLAQQINSLGDRLRGGVPVEYAVRDLTTAGLDRDAALRLVEASIGANRKSCAGCGLSYAATVTQCAECQQPL